MSLKGKNIVLGITGSIAAYKACTIVRLLVKAGAAVQVVLTPAGKEFVTPLTLATLSQRAVASEFFDRRDGSWYNHVDMGLWADAMLIAPCTAATLGKMVHGIADNLLITTYLSMKAPVFVAPAMDLDMYLHPSTHTNLAQLQEWGHHIIEPTSGFLASGLEGKGRMEEPERIVEELERFFATQNPNRSTLPSAAPQKITNKRLLITAGPTYERIDPVRFIGNFSTGKMGFALAQVAAQMGWQVDLVAGPVQQSIAHPNISRYDVESAEQMHAKCLELFPQAAAAILCAAVADFAPMETKETKMKREATGEFVLPLKATKDIAASLGQIKQGEQRLVGFALETHNERHNAVLKLEKKNLDFIVLNSLQDAGAGFGYDTNKVSLIYPNGREENHEMMPKTEVAKIILQALCEYYT